MNNQEGWRITYELEIRGFQHNNCCYCGCGKGANPDRYFSPRGGHDLRFNLQLLAFLRDNAPDAIDMAIRHLVRRNNPKGEAA